LVNATELSVNLVFACDGSTTKKGIEQVMGSRLEQFKRNKPEKINTLANKIKSD